MDSFGQYTGTGIGSKKKGDFSTMRKLSNEEIANSNSPIES